MEKPHIAEPCSANYNQMSPADKGRFCESCCKVVVDFTKKSAQEILDFLSGNQDTCGRFRKSQLLPITVEKSPKISKRFSRFSVALFFVFGTMLFTTEGCFMGKATYKQPLSTSDFSENNPSTQSHKHDSVSDSTHVHPH